VNIKEIKEMLNLMNENGLAELEIEKEGMRIKLKKISSHSEGFAAPIVIERDRFSEDNKHTNLKEITEGKEKTTGNGLEIKAPMVGTFYRAPSPEAAPYVEVGQIIEVGQTICIIEAMKLMNEIKSEIKGKILEIFIENAEPVEFGQTMFLIEPL